MAKRIALDHCCGVIIDVQEFFLSQLAEPLRSKIETHTKSFAGLLGYLGVPLVVTLERPLEQKGTLPHAVSRRLSDNDLAQTFEKDFFDLTREEKIRDHLKALNKTQVIVAGCETDVCVLQSCLGLRSLGYEVYVVEELLFSSSHNVDAAIARMKGEGAIFLSYKSLYHELFEAVGGSRHFRKIVERFGPFPEDLSDPTADDRIRDDP
jgi:nicotinamidase-related amidase